MQHTPNGKPGFFVVAQSTLLNDRAFDLATRTFLKFFHSITPKHRRRVHFLALDASPERTALLARLNEKLEQPHPVLFSMKSSQVSELDAIRRQEAVLFHPHTAIGEIPRVELLSHCLPVLTYDVWEKAHAFERASCLFVPTSLEEQASREFHNYIRNLYFDPGALKLLRDRAIKHRRSVGNRIAAAA
ncbi:MAG: hypothetical protein ACK4Q5_08200 [Saprospiraceae bacterium]